jgi:hypothetical protein
MNINATSISSIAYLLSPSIRAFSTLMWLFAYLVSGFFRILDKASLNISILSAFLKKTKCNLFNKKKFKVCFLLQNMHPLLILRSCISVNDDICNFFLVTGIRIVCFYGSRSTILFSPLWTWTTLNNLN